MNNRELAMEFIRCFCAGDVAGLEPLLARELRFEGPFHQFRSRAEYLDSLRNDPPEEARFRIMSVTESHDSVSVFWDYVKKNKTIAIAQLFRIRDQAICDISLVFDGRESP